MDILAHLRNTVDILVRALRFQLNPNKNGAHISSAKNEIEFKYRNRISHKPQSKYVNPEVSNDIAVKSIECLSDEKIRKRLNQ